MKNKVVYTELVELTKIVCDQIDQYYFSYGTILNKSVWFRQFWSSSTYTIVEFFTHFTQEVNNNRLGNLYSQQK